MNEIVELPRANPHFDGLLHKASGNNNGIYEAFGGWCDFLDHFTCHDGGHDFEGVFWFNPMGMASLW